LRKGVQFTNGEEFNAAAVQASFSAFAGNDSKIGWKAVLAPIKAYRTVDPYTIDLLTETPLRPLLRNTTSSFAMSPRAVHGPRDEFTSHPIGTGQMKFVEYRPGQHVIVESNPQYWGPKSHFDRIQFRFIKENGTRIAALQAGDVMMIDNVPPDQVAGLKANPALNVLVAPTNRTILIAIRADRKPFDDVRVRQAMNYAVDKESITKNIFGGMAAVARSVMTNVVFGYDGSLPPYRYDPDKAKKLLSDAGATGATFRFGAPNGRYLLDKQVAEALVEYLDAVGLKVVFDNPDWGVFVQEVYKPTDSKYDGYMFGWSIPANEPDSVMHEWFYSKTSYFRSSYRNPQVDSLIEQGEQTFDLSQARQAYQKLQRIIWQDAPWIFLYEQPQVYAINKKLQWTDGRRDEYMLFKDASVTR